MLAGSAVGAAQHDLDGIVGDSGAAKDVAERHARPDRLGDRSDPPREPVARPVELGTPVPRTFEHHGEGAVLERAERDPPG